MTKDSSTGIFTFPNLQVNLLYFYDSSYCISTDDYNVVLYNSGNKTGGSNFDITL